MNSFKFIFGFFLFYLTLAGCTANTWISLWLIIEISFTVFMGLLSINLSCGIGELMMKYFIVQVFAGLVVAICVLLSPYVVSFVVDGWIGIGLFIKLGLTPFHFWIIGLLGKLSWLGAFFMLGVMKLLPTIFIIYSMDLMWLGSFLWGSIVVGSIFGVGNSSIQKLLGYSGMVNVCWMLFAAPAGGAVCFFFFFFGYLFLLLVFCMFVSLMGVYYLNQFKASFSCLSVKIYFFIFSMVFSGIPPFFGFLLKWWVSWFLGFSGMCFTVCFLICLSLFSLIFYFQLWFYFMLIYGFDFKWYICFFTNFNWVFFFFFCFFGLLVVFLFV